MRWLSILLLISGCGKKINVENVSVNTEFVPYVKLFEETYNTTNLVNIEFGVNFKGNAVGTCYPLQQTINIKETYWYWATEIQKTSLIFHELGHCQFGWEHDNNLDTNGCPTTFMFEYIPKISCLFSIFNNLVYKQGNKK